MSTSGHKPWLSNLVDWIPGMGSKKPVMAAHEHALHHRYKDWGVLCTTLEAWPFNFKRKDIKLKATSNEGLRVKLPRKLTDEEIEQIYDAFYNAAHPEEAEEYAS